MRTIGYIFLAAEEEHLLSMEEQQQQLMQFCSDTLEDELQDVFIEEDGTLKKPMRERFEGRRLLEQLKEGDRLLVVRSSWVLGSAREALRFIKHLAQKQVALYCLDLGENISTPNERKLVVSEGPARLVTTLLESLATCENSKHGATIKAAKKQLKRKGRYLGGPVPFGWRVNKEGILVQNASEQSIIKEILRLREDRWSYRDISQKLKENFDLKLSHEGVRKVLERNRVKLAEQQKKKEFEDVAAVKGLEKHAPGQEE